MNFTAKYTILTLLINNVAFAQVLTNGSFENNVFVADGSLSAELSSNQYDTDSTPVITGWTTTGTVLTLMGTTTDGSYSAALPPHADGGVTNALSQPFSLTANGPHLLTLDTFFPVPPGVFAPNAIAGGVATITDASNSLVTSWNFSAAQGDGVADNLSHSFNAGAGTYTLNLSSLAQLPPGPVSTSRTAIIVDNVAITSVPEPSGVIMVLLGSLALTTRRMRINSIK